MTAVETDRALQGHERTFLALLAAARDHVRADDVAAAFLMCELAAQFASHNHPGFFASAECEDLVVAMTDGMASAHRQAEQPPDRVESVLHVMTEAYTTGGHSKLVQRWIEQDRSRRHSLALTTSYEPVPEGLAASVGAAEETLTQLRSESDLATRVATLRETAAAHDIVLLSTHPSDCLTLAAFGARTHGPPVAFVDHADHCFWVGRRAADLVVHLGTAGQRLGERRRGLSPDSTTTLPIPLGHVRRVHTRQEAKHALGLEDSSLVLCTAAASHKYASLGEVHFLDLVTGVVQRHPEVVLLAAGVEPDARWEAAAQATGGRIRALGLVEDVESQLDAADIYLDSYPVASNTSWLEATTRATPVVVFDPGPTSLGVLRAGEPGEGGGLSRAHDLPSYQALLENLIVNGTDRHRSGRQLADVVMKSHIGPGWLDACERVYSRLLSARRTDWCTAASEGPRDELDEALCVLAERQAHTLETLVALRALRSGQAAPLPGPGSTPEIARQIAEGNALGLQARAVALEAKAAGLERRIAEMQAGVDSMTGYIAALQRTLSWRVTAPLRWLSARRPRR